MPWQGRRAAAQTVQQWVGTLAGLRIWGPGGALCSGNSSRYPSGTTLTLPGLVQGEKLKYLMRLSWLPVVSSLQREGKQRGILVFIADTTLDKGSRSAWVWGKGCSPERVCPRADGGNQIRSSDVSLFQPAFMLHA